MSWTARGPWPTEFDEEFDFHEQLRRFGWEWDVTKWTTSDGREHKVDHHVPELIAELKRLRVSAAQVAALVEIFFTNGGEEGVPGFGKGVPTDMLGPAMRTLGQNPSRAEIAKVVDEAERHIARRRRRRGVKRRPRCELRHPRRRRGVARRR